MTAPTVTQRDREAAVLVAGLFGTSGTLISDMLNGTCEAIPHEYEKQVAMLEAFARHRAQTVAEVVAFIREQEANANKRLDECTHDKSAQHYAAAAVTLQLLIKALESGEWSASCTTAE